MQILGVGKFGGDESKGHLRVFEAIELGGPDGTGLVIEKNTGGKGVLFYRCFLFFW